MSAEVNPNELRSAINIISKEEGLDENGFPATVHALKYQNVRAKAKTQSTKEYVNADKFQSQLAYKFIVYYREDLDASMFIEYKGKFFDIQHIHIFDSGYFCELTGVESQEDITY